MDFFRYNFLNYKKKKGVKMKEAIKKHIGLYKIVGKHMI